MNKVSANLKSDLKWKDLMAEWMKGCMNVSSVCAADGADGYHAFWLYAKQTNKKLGLNMMKSKTIRFEHPVNTSDKR